MNYELNEEEIKSILERLEEIRTDIEEYKYIYNSTLKTIKDLAEDLEFYKNQLEEYENRKYENPL